MANIKIIDLPTGSPESDSFIEATQVNVQAESGRSSAKVAFNAFGNWIAGQGQSPLQYNGLNTDSDTLIGAINELLVYVLNIADEYDPTATYDVDDYCIYQGVLYKCTTAITVAEAWNSAHWTSTLIVDEFGTGGGASVTLGTTVPSDASGENGDLYVQYDGTSYDFVDLFVKINGSWRKAPYSRVVALTQAQYDLITPDPTTLYIITDAQSSYQTKSDNSLATTDKTVVGAINEVNTAMKPLLETSITVTKTSSNPNIPNLGASRIGKVCILRVYANMPQASYSPNSTLWSIDPPPKSATFAVIRVYDQGSPTTDKQVVMFINTSGEIKLNDSFISSAAGYWIGEIVYICD